jgi:hypothetical protein
MEILAALQQALKSGFSYDRREAGQIFCLETSLYLRLLQDKIITGDFFKGVVYPEANYRDGLILAIGDNGTEGLWDDDEPKSLEPFITHVHLAYYKSIPEPELQLISPLSLFEILPVYADQFSHIQNIDYWVQINQEADHRGRMGRTVKWLRKEKNISGRVYTCDLDQCGWALCAAGFAWIKNGFAFFYMYTGSDSITDAWIYPFYTDCYVKHEVEHV